MDILLAVSIAFLVFSIMIIVLKITMQDRAIMSSRLKELLNEEEFNIPIQTINRQKKQRHITVSRAFAQELSTAGIRMRPEEYLAIWLCAALLPSGLLMLAGVHPVTLIAVALIGVSLPPIITRRKKEKRLQLFEKQLGDALLLMGNCLRSGLTFQQAMANIGKEMPEPIGREFSRTVKEIQLGSNLEDALNNMLARIHSTDLMLMISAVIIQRQVGGNMMEILENISVTIKERLKLKDDIRVMTATGRISGIVVGLIPLVIGGMLMLINPAYILTFFDTSLGIALLVTAAVMELIGFLLIKQVITIKY